MLDEYITQHVDLQYKEASEYIARNADRSFTLYL